MALPLPVRHGAVCAGAQPALRRQPQLWMPGAQACLRGLRLRSAGSVLRRVDGGGQGGEAAWRPGAALEMPLRLREEFRAGLRRLQGDYVDIFIGNHQDQCDTIGKSERIRAGEADAFVVPSAWPLYLADCEQKLDRMLAEEAESFRTGE